MRKAEKALVLTCASVLFAAMLRVPNRPEPGQLLVDLP